MQVPAIQPDVAIIGAGPAGLMAAEVLANAGRQVHLYDTMPTFGRKLLRAGIGGLNITHAEELDSFVRHFGSRHAEIGALLAQFSPEDLLQWVHGLGIGTFVGSSRRVFPVGKKAAPLLRAWLHRLRALGVVFHPRHRWTGWEDDTLQFTTAAGDRRITPRATLLALGGASWPQLGSDGAWVPWLHDRGAAVAPLKPSNCGFHVSWSEHFRERFARQPVKSLRASLDGEHWESGELMVTADGLEGGLLYALSAAAREQVAEQGTATLWLDLNPGRDLAALTQRLAQPQGSRSLAKHLKDKAGIEGIKAGLLREFATPTALHDPAAVAGLIKALPVPLGQPFAIARAISSAGGVPFEAMNARLMLNALPGTFCAGEMLDWEAPTGGYLLTACIASGFVAGKGIAQFLETGERG